MAYVWRKHVLEFAAHPWKLFRLADTRTPPQVKAQLVADFKGSNACCLPPGLARTAKDAGVDMQSADAREFLYWYSYMVRTTTSDVEVRHTRNNVSSGGSGNIDFSNIVSQYVTAEWGHLKRAAVMAHMGMGGHAFRRLMVSDVTSGDMALAMPGGEGAGQAAPPAKQIKASATGRRRGRTAIQCYAAEHDLSHLKVKGKVTVAYHKQLTNDFNELPEERKALYEAQATMSLVRAREQEATEVVESAKALAPLAAQPAGSNAAAAIGDAPASANAALAVLPMNIVMTAGAATEDQIVAGVERASMHISEAVELYASNDEDRITNAIVEEASFKEFIDAAPVKTIANDFQSSARRVGRPPAGFHFPDVVEYPHRCRCFCEESETAANSKALMVLSMLSQCAKRCGSPSKVPSAGMLLLADVFTGPPESRIGPVQSCWWMIGASFQSGHHVPTQTFWKCVPVGGGGGGGGGDSLGHAGQRFVVERGVFVDMEERHPQLSAQSAPPAFYNEEAVARILVTDDTLCEETIIVDEQLASEVALTKLLFEEQSDSCLTILGVDPDFAAMRMAEVQQQEKKTKKKPPAAYAHAGTYFMALFDEEVAGPKPAPTVRSLGPTQSASPLAPNALLAKETATAKLAVELGLKAGPIIEDPWGDAGFMDGIRESAGDDAIAVIAAVRQDLEENEEELQEAQNEKVAEDAAMQEARQGTEEELGSSSAGGPGGPIHVATVAAPATAKKSYNLGALHVVYTGWASGIYARAFPIGSVGGSSASSSAAASSSTSPVGHLLGHLHRVNDQGMKLTCKKHKNCVCWVSFRNNDRDETERKLFMWLSDGLAATQAAHQAKAVELKISMGMRITRKS